MGEPRHSEAYYAIKEHYNRKNWEDRELFVNTTRKNVQNANILKNKGFIKGAYTNYKSPNPRQFHADHQVAIKEAWQSGGYKWTPSQKKGFAHDVSNIVMSESAVNRQKGYKGIEKWKPPHNIKQYLLRREATKKKYNLTSTKEEFKVFTDIMKRKPDIRMGARVEQTKYCTRCHINHSINQHKK